MRQRNSFENVIYCLIGKPFQWQSLNLAQAILRAAMQSYRPTLWHSSVFAHPLCAKTPLVRNLGNDIRTTGHFITLQCFRMQLFMYTIA